MLVFVISTKTSLFNDLVRVGWSILPVEIECSCLPYMIQCTQFLWNKDHVCDTQSKS